MKIKKLSNYIQTHFRYTFVFLLFVLSLTSSNNVILPIRSPTAEFCCIKGVVDRFEDKKAVILLEAIDKEIVVKKSSLPSKSETDTWLNIKQSNRNYIIHSVDKDKTHEKVDQINKMLIKLRKTKDLDSSQLLDN